MHLFYPLATDQYQFWIQIRMGPIRILDPGSGSALQPMRIHICRSVFRVNGLNFALWFNVAKAKAMMHPQRDTAEATIN